jgi:hypothetical protein
MATTDFEYCERTVQRAAIIWRLRQPGIAF